MGGLLRPARRIGRIPGRLVVFGPDAIVEDDKFKAGARYFPKIAAPYRMDLDDLCYLYVTDANGGKRWESLVDPGAHKTGMSDREKRYVVETFAGTDPDPSVWLDVETYERHGLRGRFQKHKSWDSQMSSLWWFV